MSDTIKFYKGEETGIVHESYSDISTSLFKDQYLKALNEIGAYLENSKQWELNENRRQFDINNIFAFIGDRGAGKTSCMESFADMLQKHYSTQKSKKIDFLIIDTIDPTIFNNNSNILEVVIGVLFEQFKRQVEETDTCSVKNTDQYNDLKHKVISQFQSVKYCLNCLFSENPVREACSDTTRLTDLASVIKLYDLFKELISLYLKFFHKDYLVVKIDDIDLQTSYAYQMVEQIRKYFVQEKVIILFAVKMEQLSYVIEKENSKNYKDLLESKRMNIEQMTDIATKYILKLIPASHRIYLPKVEVYVNKKLLYFDITREEAKTQRNYKPQNYGDVKYAITALSYIKCRYLFYHTKGIISPIVPRNLRELRYLFSMLVNMKPYDHTENTFGNKTKFKEYFNTIWVNSNISPCDYRIVDNINNVMDASLINKVVVINMFERFEHILGNSQFSDITDARNSSYNISIGDVFAIVDYIKKRVSSVEDRMLLFYIETFYSIKLYEYYDELTEHVDIKNSNYLFEINDSIKKREVVEGISNYECLVGGSFLNTDKYSFTPADRDSAQTRDRRKLDLKKLKEETKKILDSENLDAKKLQIVEFFALCTSRIIESSDVANKNYRQSNELYYTYFGKNEYNKAQFDLGAFFFNVVDIERAYDRIHTGLFDKASQEGVQSLYNGLKKTCIAERNVPDRYDSKHAILSCVSIRNYEILDDFVHTIEFNNSMRSLSARNSDNIKEFFSRVSKYYINIYSEDVNEPNDINYIEFSYASIIRDMFDWSKDSEYEKLFESIYLTETFEEFQSFDVSKLLTVFAKYPTTARNVKLKVFKYCKTIFEINNVSKQDFNNYVQNYCDRYSLKNLEKKDLESLLIKFANEFISSNK